jgi:hypothetical protein
VRPPCFQRTCPEPVVTVTPGLGAIGRGKRRARTTAARLVGRRNWPDTGGLPAYYPPVTGSYHPVIPGRARDLQGTVGKEQ